MSTLLVPVAPLSKTKSRLKDCFSAKQLKELTIAMFNDLGKTLTKVNCFDHMLVYCNSPEILDLTKYYDLIGIKEEISDPSKSFDEIIEDINNIAIKKYHSKKTIVAFIDLILISSNNFYEIDMLLKKNQLVICPAIHSAGISILGRNPPDIIPSYFSDPITPSLIALLRNASKRSIDNIAIYDSFRAGFDMDIKQDLVLSYIYLKTFKLTDTETFKFLKNNLKLTLRKKSVKNNRSFEIIDKD
jgi:2-phospho-L-lactate guanylyltransferase (CobY/MobA/RfbA family)